MSELACKQEHCHVLFWFLDKHQAKSTIFCFGFLINTKQIWVVYISTPATTYPPPLITEGHVTFLKFLLPPLKCSMCRGGNHYHSNFVPPINTRSPLVELGMPSKKKPRKSQHTRMFVKQKLLQMTNKDAWNHVGSPWSSSPIIQTW